MKVVAIPYHGKTARKPSLRVEVELQDLDDWAEIGRAVYMARAKSIAAGIDVTRPLFRVVVRFEK